MAGVGTQPTSLRKYLGALKDTTTVSLAKVNSDYKVENSINPLKNVWKFSCSIAYCYMLHSAAGLALSFFKTGIGYCNCEGYKPC